jgi:hypothetical protein
MYYLWFVIPFWTTMNGFTNGQFHESPYLWTNRVNGDQSIASLADFWDTDFLSKVLNDIFMQDIGVQMNTAEWRHCAIGISRCYCHDETPDEDGIDGLDDDNESDNIWDLQAGHDTNTANRLYALQFNRCPPHICLDMYHGISTRWHGFLLPDYRSIKRQNQNVTVLYKEHLCQI